MYAAIMKEYYAQIDAAPIDRVSKGELVYTKKDDTWTPDEDSMNELINSVYGVGEDS